MPRWLPLKVALLGSLVLGAAACLPGDFDDLVGDAERDSAVHAGDTDTPNDRADASGGAQDAGGEGDAAAGAGGRGGASGAGAGGRDAATMDAADEPAMPPDDAASPGGGDSATGEDGAVAGTCTPAADRTAVRAKDVAELGAVSVPDVEVDSLGSSGRVGDRVLWVVNTGQQVGVWTDLDVSLLAVAETPGSTPLLPANAVPASLMSGIGSIVALDEQEALIYFGSGYVFTSLGAPGLARIGVDDVQAELVHAAGEFLPSPAGSSDWTPMFTTSALVHDDNDARRIYVWACNAKPDVPAEGAGGLDEGPCRLARVEADRAEDGAAYRYWNGSAWVVDVADAAIAIRAVGSGLSIAYNRYLQAFLAVHSDSTGQVVLRWAARPEGPWHPLDQIETLPANSVYYPISFGASERRELRDACDRTLHVTYILPVRDVSAAPQPLTDFETRVMRVELE